MHSNALLKEPLDPLDDFQRLQRIDEHAEASYSALRELLAFITRPRTVEFEHGMRGSTVTYNMGPGQFRSLIEKAQGVVDLIETSET